MIEWCSAGRSRSPHGIATCTERASREGARSKAAHVQTSVPIRGLECEHFSSCLVVIYPSHAIVGMESAPQGVLSITPPTIGPTRIYRGISLHALVPALPSWKTCGLSLYAPPSRPLPTRLLGRRGVTVTLPPFLSRGDEAGTLGPWDPWKCPRGVTLPRAPDSVEARFPGHSCRVCFSPGRTASAKIRRLAVISQATKKLPARSLLDNHGIQCLVLWSHQMSVSRPPIKASEKWERWLTVHPNVAGIAPLGALHRRKK